MESAVRAKLGVKTIGFIIVGIVSVTAFVLLCLKSTDLLPSSAAEKASTKTAPAPRDRETNRIVLAADAWPPYNNESGDTQEGFLVDVAKEILTPAGYVVEYEVVPWKRALAGGADGTYDGVLAPSPDEGPTLIFPEEYLSFSRTCFFVNKENPWRFRDPASLLSVSVGAVLGYDYAHWFNAHLEKYRHDFTRVQLISGKYPLAQNLRKLDAGHIDVLAGNEFTVRYAAQKLRFSDKIALAGCSDEGSPCYIAFSPKRKDAAYLASLMTSGIRQMRATGRLSTIMSHYGLELDEAALDE